MGAPDDMILDRVRPCLMGECALGGVLTDA
jgi:hypothetical protein